MDWRQHLHYEIYSGSYSSLRLGISTNVCMGMLINICRKIAHVIVFVIQQAWRSATMSGSIHSLQLSHLFRSMSPLSSVYDGSIIVLNDSDNDEAYSISSDFPQPLRKSRRGNSKSKRLALRKQAARESWRRFKFAQSHSWAIEDAGRCVTGYKGLTNNLCKGRVIVDPKMNGENHLKILLDNGYKKVEIRYIYKCI